MMASLVNHQSQFFVPPTPLILPLSIGKLSPECRKAVVLPAPGGPTIMYQGRE